MERAVEPLFAARDYTQALQQLAALRHGVDGFFDSVMVMADDPEVRANRLALLARLRGLFLQVADLSRLPGQSAAEGGTVQQLRSLIYTVMLFLTTAFFAVVVIVFIWLPAARLYAVARSWARTAPVAAQDALRSRLRDRRRGTPARRAAHLDVEALVRVGNDRAGCSCRRVVGAEARDDVGPAGRLGHCAASSRSRSIARPAAPR